MRELPRAGPVGYPRRPRMDLQTFVSKWQQSRAEERPCSGDVSTAGDEDVDDLAVLVDSSVDVAPNAGDFDVGLIHEQARPDDTAARAGPVDRQRRETLRPPEQGDVIDLDAALREEFVEIAIRQTETEIPADRQHDHLRREPEAGERRRVERRHWTTATPHYSTLADARRSVNATVPVIIHGHAFMQNLRRGHYELGTDAQHDRLRIAAAFNELATAI